jgi:hypothetical protein
MALWSCHARAPEVRPFGLHALDDGSAVVISLQGEPATWHLARIDAHGRSMWSHWIPEEPQIVSMSDGMFIGPDVIAVRYLERAGTGGRFRLAAFDRADGRALWDTELGREDVRHDSADGTTPVFGGVYVGDHFVVGVDLAHSIELVSVDARTGFVDRRFQTEKIVETTWVHGDRLYVDLFDYTVVIDPRNHTLSDTSDARAGCMHLAPLAQLMTSERLLRCGSYRDRVIAVFQMNGPVTTGGLRVVDVDTHGRILRTIELGGSTAELRDEYARWSSDAGAFSGELTRFVPFIIEENNEPDQLLVVDLEAARVSWRVTLDVNASSLLRTGPGWYLIDDRFAPHEIAMIDGASGTVSKAVRLLAPVREVRPRDIAGGALWLYSPEWSVSGVPLARLDASTLEPSFPGKIPTVDVTAEARQLAVQ